MASGFQVAGVDLDSKFMARSTTARAAVGYQVAGSDICNRYEKYTVGTQVAATGLKTGGTDLNTLFQNISVPIFTPVTRTYDSASGTETVPSGAASCTIKVWGGGGGGARTASASGWGGGGGGYASIVVGVSGG